MDSLKLIQSLVNRFRNNDNFKFFIEMKIYIYKAGKRSSNCSFVLYCKFNNQHNGKTKGAFDVKTRGPFDVHP